VQPMAHEGLQPVSEEISMQLGMDRPSMATASAVEEVASHLHLYQILSPCFAERGRMFGSKMKLKEGWVQVALPYFSAPGRH
jgi:hypothetical protein